MIHDSVKNLFDLTGGEVAIVTGGLGQLGSQYTDILSAAGASVAVFDIRDEPSAKVKKLIDEGRPISVHKVDITKKEEVKRGYGEVVSQFGVPTILVNNAGIDATPDAHALSSGPYEDYPEEIWDAVIDSHLKGMFFMSQEFIRHFRAAQEKGPPPQGASLAQRNWAGSIINISSTYGIVSPDQAMYDFKRENGKEFYKSVAYSVAKSGVLNFTRWLAEYCRQRKVPVRVNTLVPGGVFQGHPDIFIEECKKRTILARMAREDEYNGAILFLASHKASSYMTGSMLVIDGGWTAR